MRRHSPGLAPDFALGGCAEHLVRKRVASEKNHYEREAAGKGGDDETDDQDTGETLRPGRFLG